MMTDGMGMMGMMILMFLFGLLLIVLFVLIVVVVVKRLWDSKMPFSTSDRVSKEEYDRIKRDIE
jgi:uncharacterized membrane protein YhaH (DUF805 family)